MSATRGRRPVATSNRSPQAGAVFEANDVVGSVPDDARGSAAEVDSQPLARERLRERVTERARLARQDVIHSLDQIDVGAEGGERLGHLHAHGTATEDYDACGDLARAGRLAVGPNAVELGEARDRRDDWF